MNANTLCFTLDSVNYQQQSASVSSTQLVQVINKINDGYRFGFNGQEKVDEIAGAGNHNTAEFWEYDTRLGRRWNVDPVKKPSLSDYSTFSGNPIWKVDPNGDDDYYNKFGKFIGSDGIGSNLRLMDNDKIQDARTFSVALAMAQKLKIDIEAERDNVSRVITFKNEGAAFKNLYTESKDGAERGTYIVFDANKAEVRTNYVSKGDYGSNDITMLGSGSQFSDFLTVLSTVHTHYQEELYFKKGRSDLALFNSQYSIKGNTSSDGDMARSANQLRYSIGKYNVNFYSPDKGGVMKSSNNSGSRKDLESGKYEIGKESLINYGHQTEKVNNLLILLILCISFQGISGCKIKDKRKDIVELSKIDKVEDRKIIYSINKDIANYISENMMNPKLCNVIEFCTVYIANKHINIELYYHSTQNDTSINFLIRNTKRYLDINGVLVPVILREDLLLGDIPKGKMYAKDKPLYYGREFGLMEVDLEQNFIEAGLNLRCGDENMRLK
jgi:hypothetical protein